MCFMEITAFYTAVIVKQPRFVELLRVIVEL